MEKRQLVMHALAACMLISMSACSDRNENNSGATQTGFPGQVTAGGGTSGDVMGRVGQTKDGSYAGGTPGIAGGSGGNTGGAATGGSVQESGRGPSEGVSPVAPAAGPPASPRQQ